MCKHPWGWKLDQFYGKFLGPNVANIEVLVANFGVDVHKSVSIRL
jgi:hypothetical protein